MNRILVLGTGTNVGKTTFASALLAGARARGLTVLGLKPVESGPSNPSDAALLGKCASQTVPPLYRFPVPLSPHLAAERAGITVDLDAISAWVAERESSTPGLRLSVIETAGGLCTPLTLRESNLDLAVRFPDARRVLVASNRLGSLHDVMVCVSLMHRLGIAPSLIVLSGAVPRDIASETNGPELQRLSGLPVLEQGDRDLPPSALELLTATVP